MSNCMLGYTGLFSKPYIETSLMQAKKKGGGKKKGPGSLMDAPKAAEPYLEAQTIMQNLLMVESYKRKVGR